MDDELAEKHHAATPEQEIQDTATALLEHLNTSTDIDLCSDFITDEMQRTLRSNPVKPRDQIRFIPNV